LFPIKDSVPTDRFPVVTIALIVANFAAYFWSIGDGGSFISGPDQAFVFKWGFIPYEVGHLDQCLREGAIRIGDCPGQPSLIGTALMSMFLHGGAFHLAGNMVFLWVFGNNVEDAMGPLRFIAFYVLGGVAALLGQYAVGSNEVVPLIGASGAVAGVLGGYLLLYPRARVVTLVFIILFFTIIEIPAMLFLVIWFGQQLLFGWLDFTNPAGGGGGVAYFAHIGGFVFGLAAIKLFATRAKTGYDSPRHPVY
jgi:membrane associated rhomboid family serine protease